MNAFKQVVAIGALALFASMASAADLKPQDFAEIGQLYAKYNQAIDSGNAEGWADTFTPDGVFSKTTVGRDALIAFAKGFYESGSGKRRHWNDNLILTGTAEGADGSVYLMLWDTGNRPATLMVSGIYEDKLVKTKNGWRFKSRAVKVDTAKPAAAATPTQEPAK